MTTVVYGGTWAGVNAACAAMIAGDPGGAKIINPYLNFGGCMSNGLGAVDLGRYGSHGIGWLTSEWRRRQTAYYGTRVNLTRTTPSQMEQVLMDMMKFYGVEMWNAKTLASVSKTGAHIDSITMATGEVFAASNYLDCTEDGDLAKMAGVTMVSGRESAAQYGESLAGFYPVPESFIPFDCYASPGVLLPNFSPYPPALNPGDADAGIQAYTFRMCLTQKKENKRKFVKPIGYDPTKFEYLRRAIPAGLSTWKPIGGAACLDAKYDMNGDYGIPYQWDWPESTPAQRVVILNKIYVELAGWLWFLANDPSINPQVQDYVNTWGTPLDEFTAAGATSAGWPKELYVRVSRRMVGQYVMTQFDLQSTITKADSIAMGFYSIDNHVNQRLAVVMGGVPGYIFDSLGAGSDTAARQVIPYQIPYRASLPLITECTNLGVPVAGSWSNVAMSSGRIDIHKANVASAMGYACGKAAKTASTLNALNVTDLQTDITNLGQVIAYTSPEV